MTALSDMGASNIRFTTYMTYYNGPDNSVSTNDVK